MPSITAGRTTTQNTRGLLGVLRLFGERPNLLLRLIGGYQPGEPGEGTIVGNGWTPVVQRRFPLSVDYILPTPAQPSVLEGATAPTANTYTPAQDDNVVQLFHETVDVSYLAASEVGRMDPDGVLSIGSQDQFHYSGLPQTQLAMALRKIARDFNFSALNGTFANPANPVADAVRMRGIIPAITTNVVDAAGAALSRALIHRLYREMIVNSGVQPETGLILLSHPTQLDALNTAYETQFRQGQDRMIGGLMTREVYTPYGVLRLPNVGAYDLDVPETTLVLVNPEPIRGRYLPVKGETILVEPLAKVGSSDQTQIYGQMGIDYGAEWLHGKIENLAIPAGDYDYENGYENGNGPV
jgi:hypothetical protein